MEVYNSNFFDQLASVTNGELESSCRSIPPSFESRKGISEVTAFRDEDGVTLFERGKWHSVYTREEINFTNTLRFRRLKGSDRIALEHLRYGKNQPVLLFELDPIGPKSYRSLAPYICNEDTYTGSVLIDDHFILLSWRMTGPKKNHSLRALYTFSS